MLGMMYKKISGFLLLTVLLLSLCACGGKGRNRDGGSGADNDNDNIAGLKKVKPENVYSVSYIDGRLPGNDYVAKISTAGERIYVASFFSRPKEGEEEASYESGIALYCMNLDGSDFKKLLSFTDSSTVNEDGSTVIKTSNNLTPCPDGTVWYCSQEIISVPSKNSYSSSLRLIHAEADGTEIAGIETSALSDSPYYSINGMFLCPNGDLVLAANDSVSVLDAQGKLKYSVPKNGVYITGLNVTGSGEIIGVMNSYDAETLVSSTKLVRLNEGTMTFNEIGSLPIANIQAFIGTEGSRVIINSGSSVYSYDISSGELTELINWINSDMNFNRISNLAVLPEGRFIIAESSASHDSIAFALLSKKPESEIAEKYMLTFAATYMDTNLQDAVIKFNRQNERYRIRFSDYSRYNNNEDYNAAIAKLDYDITSGKMPDMVSMTNLAYGTYASRGLLKDLGELMAEDSSFDRSLYLDNILNAASFNARIYSVIPSFSVLTAAGKTDNVGQKLSWTMEDLDSLRQKFPKSLVFSDSSKASILTNFAKMALSSYIDLEKGVCSFNSASFIKLLEFANTFPDEADYGHYNNMLGIQDTQYKDNETLLNIVYLYSYSQMRDIMRTFGSEFSFIGFPVPKGLGSSIVPSLEIAVSSKTPLADACWSFIKTLLREEYQDSLTYTLPVMKSSLDKMAQAAMTAATAGAAAFSETGGSGGLSDPAGLADKESEPLTRAQGDQFNEIISSVSSVQRNNSDIMKIIEEEAQAFFTGQKTAADVAGLIQSRVQTYLNESK
jgi:ABC-type glycerol-3-phosphate transport system substrate-binding protein